MSHYCEFVTGASGGTSGDPVINQCDAPASIKQGGRWLCAEHYDTVALLAPDPMTPIPEGTFDDF